MSEKTLVERINDWVGTSPTGLPAHALLRESADHIASLTRERDEAVRERDGYAAQLVEARAIIAETGALQAKAEVEVARLKKERTR